MFAYCLNNPVNLSDYSGALPAYAFLGDNHIFSDNILRGGAGGGTGYYSIPTSRQASEDVIKQEIQFMKDGTYDEFFDAVLDTTAVYKFIRGTCKIAKGIGISLAPDPTLITDLKGAKNVVDGLRLIVSAIVEWAD